MAKDKTVSKIIAVAIIVMVTASALALLLLTKEASATEGSFYDFELIYSDGSRRPVSGGLNLLAKSDLSIIDTENNKKVDSVLIETHTVAEYSDTITVYEVSGSYNINLYDNTNPDPIATVCTEYIAYSDGAVPSGQDVTAHSKELSMADVENAYTSWEDGPYWLVIETASPITVTLIFASGKQTPLSFVPNQLAWNFEYVSNEQFYSLNIFWGTTYTENFNTITIIAYVGSTPIEDEDIVLINGVGYAHDAQVVLPSGQHTLSWDTSTYYGYYAFFQMWDSDNVVIADDYSETTTITVSGDGEIVLLLDWYEWVY